jgi:sulfatase modifying factor 1
VRLCIAAILSLVLLVPNSRPAPTAGTQPAVNDGYGDLVFVPASAFRMGDNFGDGLPRERPVHTVEIDAFYIGKFEITNAQWKKFRDDPGYDDVKFWPGGLVVPKDQVSYWKDANNHGGGTPDSDDYPVMGVNWDSAVAYCNWVSAKTGKKYRLPTEAEWEKAARGTDQRKYPWGNELDRSYANYNYASSAAFGTSTKVGAFDGAVHGDLKTHNAASPYGAYDMAGNLMEWCSDWYSRDYYSVSPRKNPKGPATGSYRIVRGGSFYLEALDMRAYARSAAGPSFLAHRMIGFRVAREP